jgi:hypothetical protein
MNSHQVTGKPSGKSAEMGRVSIADCKEIINDAFARDAPPTTRTLFQGRSIQPIALLVLFCGNSLDHIDFQKLRAFASHIVVPEEYASGLIFGTDVWEFLSTI